MKRVLTIEKYWPVVIRSFDGDYPNEEIRRWLYDDCARILARQEPHLVINDLQRGGTDSVQRKLVAEWIRENSAMLNKYRIATGTIVSSTLVKGIVTAIFWITPPPYRHEVFANVGDAVDWANREIAAAGLQAAVKLMPWR